MKGIISNELKRYNYLFGETGAVYHEISLKLGMSDSAMAVLYAVLEKGGICPLQYIYRSTGQSKKTVNSAIRKLEAQKIIYLTNADFKSKTVHFTESGKSLAEKTAGRVIKAENEIFASWTRENVKKYLELTEAFLNALKEKAGNIREEIQF